MYICICMPVHVHTCMYMYVCTCTCTYVYVCMYMYICICMYVHVHMYMYVCTCTYVVCSVHVHMYMYILHVYVYLYILVNTHRNSASYARLMLLRQPLYSLLKFIVAWLNHRGFLTLMIVVMYSKFSNSSSFFLLWKLTACIHSYFYHLSSLTVVLLCICKIVGVVLPCRHGFFCVAWPLTVTYVTRTIIHTCRCVRVQICLCDWVYTCTCTPFMWPNLWNNAQ